MSELVTDNELFPCICCGQLTRSRLAPGSYEVCENCGWEDDPMQFDNPNFAGGANRVSLATARENYAEYGRADPDE